MDLLKVERRPSHWVLRLDRGRGNALHTPGLLQLHRELQRARSAGAPPLILTASGASFCTGLDLEFARTLDRAGMRELMSALHLALLACFAYPGPTVACLPGHTLAGGALLALACDRRVLALGESKMGIHGVTLGIVYPDVAVELVRHRLPRAQVERVLYRGELVGDLEALRRGLVDELVEPTGLLAHGEAWLQFHRGPGFRAHKRAVLRPVTARLAHIGTGGMESWLDRWFDPNTQAALEAARAARRSRSRNPAEPPREG